MEPNIDLRVAHRWFAVEANNAAWDILEQTAQTQEEVERMLQAAQVAFFHWRAVGTSLNYLRALTLLSMAYCRAEISHWATHCAVRCVEMLPQVSDATPFDAAMAHGCAAMAYRAVAAEEKAQEHGCRALDLAATLNDPEERQVFDRLFVKSLCVSP